MQTALFPRRSMSCRPLFLRNKSVANGRSSRASHHHHFAFANYWPLRTCAALPRWLPCVGSRTCADATLLSIPLEWQGVMDACPFSAHHGSLAGTRGCPVCLGAVPQVGARDVDNTAGLQIDRARHLVNPWTGQCVRATTDGSFAFRFFLFLPFLSPTTGRQTGSTFRQSPGSD